MTPVFGEFLGPAGEHIAAAVSFRGELPYSAQRGVVRQLDRLVSTLARYLGDLPMPDALDPAVVDVGAVVRPAGHLDRSVDPVHAPPDQPGHRTPAAT